MRYVAWLLLLLLVTGPVYADPVYNAATCTHNNATASQSAALTIGGSNRYLICFAGTADALPVNVSTLTWNTSENLTRLTTVVNGPFHQLEAWQLVNPSATTANVVATWGGSQSRVILSCGAYTSVHQTVATGTLTSNSTQSVGPATVTVSSAAGEVVVAGVHVDNPTVAITSTQTQRCTATDAVNGQSSEVADAPGAASVTFSESWTGILSRWEIIGIPLKPAASSGAPSRGRAF